MNGWDYVEEVALEMWLEDQIDLNFEKDEKFYTRPGFVKRKWRIG